ncbi:putative transposase [Candidatus Nitrososphaera gargensis Ga9.2]|uniref:Putative transposase n=2 Tax=Candidatus Nitrososphaera gargensis TaxID=497727 RepID=K0IFA8_NITGG|nr:putative transposase [Candidatus Nitrososphaera gargensis Ga9.2]
MYRIPVGTLKRCTIIRDVNQWYCVIIIDDGIDKPITDHGTNKKPVGIDVGLLN